MSLQSYWLIWTTGIRFHREAGQGFTSWALARRSASQPPLPSTHPNPQCVKSHEFLECLGWIWVKPNGFRKTLKQKNWRDRTGFASGMLSPGIGMTQQSWGKMRVGLGAQKHGTSRVYEVRNLNTGFYYCKGGETHWWNLYQLLAESSSPRIWCIYLNGGPPTLGSCLAVGLCLTELTMEGMIVSCLAAWVLKERSICSKSLNLFPTFVLM